ncbi:hypothetical protein PRIPAC_82322, partial [Pristionchus pacificus]|uniref:Uncharacterized protein n=1 Tax=Pristionchus pacificus TaxID=54126 RepID=A0A2A6BVV2_PRIPA
MKRRILHPDSPRGESPSLNSPNNSRLYSSGVGVEEVTIRAVRVKNASLHSSPSLDERVRGMKRRILHSDNPSHDDIRLAAVPLLTVVCLGPAPSAVGGALTGESGTGVPAEALRKVRSTQTHNEQSQCQCYRTLPALFDMLCFFLDVPFFLPSLASPLSSEPLAACKYDSAKRMWNLLPNQRHVVQSRVVRMKNSSLRSKYSLATLTGERARGMRRLSRHVDNPNEEHDLDHYGSTYCFIRSYANTTESDSV